MPDDKKKKKPVPWEAADPAVPEIKSAVNPIDLANLPPASPDLREMGNQVNG